MPDFEMEASLSEVRRAVEEALEDPQRDGRRRGRAGRVAHH